MEETALATFMKLPAYDRTPRSHDYEQIFDLARFQRFLNRVGNPEKDLPVIHVTGSKGKGSTTVLVASALQALGYSVGAFLSPYLHHPCEAIFVNGRPLNVAIFDRFMQEHEKLLESLSPGDRVTSFEVLTTLALQQFHAQKVDYAVIETGLGGRLDATNVIQNPVVSVVCPLEKEHTEVLGHSLTAIAYEKLGIVRQGVPLVLAPQNSFVLDFAKSVCIQKKVPCVSVGTKYRASILSRSLEGYRFRLSGSLREVSSITLSLLGDHQVDNALTAWAVLEQLFGIDFDPAPVQDVWSNVTLPGRFEYRVRDGHEMILDGAHTPESARALRKTLDQLYGGESITFVLAFLDDKDVAGILQQLLRWGDAVVLTQVDHPRALPARVVEEKLHHFWPNERLSVALVNNVRIAWQKANRMAGRSPICVTGSFRLLEQL